MNNALGSKQFLAHYRLPLLGALIILVTLFRFWYCTQLELTGDEAYYWYCSHHLDWSFFDKGPGAALTIFFGRHLFGDTVFGVRFFAVLLSAATGIGLYVLARLLYSEKVACWTLIIVLFLPLYAVGSILMTIDPLSIFFWTMAAITFWRAKESSGIFWWILTGALVGMGMLAKYTNLVEFICFALFCGWMPSQRHQLQRPHFYLMIFVALLFALPMILWNKEHHWIGVMHLIKRGDLNKSWHVTPGELLTFLGAQAGVISPFFFLGVMASVFRPTFFAKAKEATYYLISLFVPLFLFYSILSLNKAAEPNWPAPCYVAGIILLAGNWDALIQKFPWAKKLVVLGLAVAALETVLLHNTFWLHLPIPAEWQENTSIPGLTPLLNWYENVGRVDPLDRAHGTVSIAKHAELLAKEQGISCYISDNYQTASLLTFYLPGHPDTYEPWPLEIKDQYSFWPGYRDVYPEGSNALFVYAWDNIPSDLKRDFSSVDLIDEAYSMDGTRPIRKYYYSVCRGLHHD